MSKPVLTLEANLSNLELDYLRVCAGEVAPLPYSNTSAMARANRRLTDLGYIESGYDDDQPTSWATDAGRLALASRLRAVSQP